MSCGKPCECPTYRDHVKSISISASATPSRCHAREANEVSAREARWEKDMPAYARLRAEGLQPKHIDGSAYFEREASDPIEIEDGHIYGKDLAIAKEVKAALAEPEAALS